MDLNREEYVADLRALAHVIAAQQATLSRMCSAVSLKDEVGREKEIKAAYEHLNRAHAAVEGLSMRIGVTSMLGQLGPGEEDILRDKLAALEDTDEDEDEEQD